MTLLRLQVTSQSHSSVVGQTVGVPAHGHPAVPVHHAHAGHAAVPAHAVPDHHAHAHAGHPGHALGKREADADADAQLVRPDLSDGTHIIPIIDCQKNAMLQIIVQMTNSPSW